MCRRQRDGVQTGHLFHWVSESSGLGKDEGHGRPLKATTISSVTLSTSSSESLPARLTSIFRRSGRPVGCDIVLG